MPRRPFNQTTPPPLPEQHVPLPAIDRLISMTTMMPLLLVLSCAVVLVVSTASGARTVGDTTSTVQDACSKTQFPKICVDSLATKPESQKKASPRKLAELFVSIAAEKGSGMATFVHGKYNNAGGAKKDEDGALFKCYDSCSDDVEEAVAHLNGLVREPTDGKFLELKSWLSSTLGGAGAGSTCEDACKDAPKSADKDAVVNFSIDFEKLQRVTLDLITEASGSMSAADIALPPSSDAAAPAAYGSAAAAAPFGGGSAEGPASAGGESAEGPAADASAPAYGGGSASASSPAAAADADADAPAAASGGPSGAPAPAASDESSGGAPGPSADGGSSESGPAPSSGDDDGGDDDSDDDGSA